MDKVTVNISLTGSQRETLANATKELPIKVMVEMGNLVVTEENVLVVRDAVVTYHRNKFNRKSKDGEVLRECFNCERIMDKIDDRLYVFGLEAPAEVEDDNANAIVDAEAEKTAKAKLVATLNKKPKDKTDGD